MATRNQVRKGIAGAFSLGIELEGPETYDEPGEYTHREASHLADSRPNIRTHGEIEADKLREPDLDTGLSSREAMPGQGENDQLPWRSHVRQKP